ncbi:WecB/TagA/CpsF family glycosyltransferase [Listeria costaricensis]|uniref:WecB/TagA/CpsF family glycosyltransferase n=1 Tax=Listeria costaricensis TaxID=2026604 RepID=UPI000C0846A9|nr:WecB/TagA/CpsF family glycosyltransferase [Listeria costaricensis]
MEKSTVRVLDIPFYNISQAAFIEELLFCADQNQKKFVVTANPEIVMNTKADVHFKQIVTSADYIVPDGVGIVMAAERLGTPLKERVTGFDTLVGILNKAPEKQFRVYFLGATPEVSSKLMEKMKISYPNLMIAGSHHGYFDLEESENITQEIIDTGADFIFVALGSPAQEKWILSHFHRFPKGIFMGVGGCFDVLSGSVKRAPQWMIKWKLEWVYRFITNPSRWRRFFAIPRFMREVKKEVRRKEVGK